MSAVRAALEYSLKWAQRKKAEEQEELVRHQNKAVLLTASLIETQATVDELIAAIAALPNAGAEE